MIDNIYASVGLCPLCGQGNLVIAVEGSSGANYILCEECYAEWPSPDAITDITKAGRGMYGRSDFLKLSETRGHPWGRFVK